LGTATAQRIQSSLADLGYVLHATRGEWDDHCESWRPGRIVGGIGLRDRLHALDRARFACRILSVHNGEFGTRRQIVGYDQYSLGGWDVKTGQRLWQLVPPVKGDFNVPTPVAVDGGVLVSTENNGTRLYHFDDSGRIISKPVAEFAGLSPTTTSPVVTGGRVFGADPALQCLDVRNGLKSVWHREEEALGDHAGGRAHSIGGQGERMCYHFPASAV
jgi:hypothetical protein